MADDEPSNRHVAGTANEPGADRLAESLARIGVLLDADRVELYRHRDDATTRLAGWWRALGVEGAPCSELSGPVDSDWFPWGLGHVRPERFVMVRNAATLPASIDGDARVGDDGTTASLLLPLRVADDAAPMGAVCAYWRTPPPAELLHLDAAAELGRDALLDCEPG
jgi:hypothetical protein